MELAAIILIIVGICLLALEIIIPNFGIVGGLGIIAIIAGVIMTSKSFIEGALLLLFILLISIIILTMLYRVMVKRNSKLILRDTLAEDTKDEELAYFIGKEGIALSSLRPSGHADFDGVKLDVISQGEFIQKGNKVIISDVQGNKIIVKQAG